MWIREKIWDYPSKMKGVTKDWMKINGLIEQSDGSYKKLVKPYLVSDYKLDSNKEVTKEVKVPTIEAMEATDRFNFNSITIVHEFDIKPCPAPRMTQSDKWRLDPYHTNPKQRQRPPVTRYFAFKEQFNKLCDANGYNLTAVLKILFVVEMPISWSKKKQFEMNHKPHQQRGDTDNLVKSVLDSGGLEDGFVWNIHAIKLWGYKPKIIIFK